MSPFFFFLLQSMSYSFKNNLKLTLNRLDSRQRKKVHTEQLEEDKRRSSSLINELQDALQEMKLRESELVREKTELFDGQQQLHQYIEQLHMEKEELIRTHTLDTGELRKKNAILREHMEKMEMNAQSSVPAAPGFRNDFSEYGNLSMDNGGSWEPEPFSLADEFTLDPEPRSLARTPTPTPANPVNLGFKAQQEKSNEKASTQADSSFSWNAFYMCLLFGAFIASNGNSASQHAIPALSEEYRAESANVLRAVLASASPSESSQLSNPSNVIGQASATATAALPTTISASEMARITSGPGSGTTNLDNLHHNLVAPTKEQEDEQAFAMSTEQYRSLTTLEEDGMGDHSAPPPSNLQQAYAAMRNNGLQNRAAGKSNSDVYSRSLLWDRVPEKVVRDFNNMVKEYGIAPVKVEESGGDMCMS